MRKTCKAPGAKKCLLGPTYSLQFLFNFIYAEPFWFPCSVQLEAMEIIVKNIDVAYVIVRDDIFYPARIFPFVC